jgi:putative ABC transport system ATP-binding protein
MSEWPPSAPPPAIAVEGLRFAYPGQAETVRLDDLVLSRKERCFLHGPSGSGKSTLLALLAGVLLPTAGRIAILGQDLATLGAAQRDRLRGAEIGFVFQLFNLLPYLSVLDNIALPCELHAPRRARLGGATPRAAARALAERLELGGHLERPVHRLSVGQQQRVAIARALIGSPALVLADEPTSALDEDLRQRFLELLFGVCAEAGAALLLVSHDRHLARYFDRRLALTAFGAEAA